MTVKELRELLMYLVSQSEEKEWLEFKLNFHSSNEIGERIAALSNSARIKNQEYGYLVFGVEDGTHQILGTTFNPAQKKGKGNEDLEPWLRRSVMPDLRFEVEWFATTDAKQIVLFRIPAASTYPTKFLGEAYVRIGSYTKKLAQYPAEEDALRYLLRTTSFEQEIAKGSLSNGDIAALLDIQTYFDKLNLPQPETTQTVIEKFVTEKLAKATGLQYGLTNLGALLFAKDLRQFEGLENKAIRVLQYESTTNASAKVDRYFYKGYASGFSELIAYVYALLPAKEVVENGIRRRVVSYPEIAVRELITNALVHQDFYYQGPIHIELFSDRIEVVNPGKPLIEPERFIDEYQTRNEKLGDLMRRLGICELRGSGFDKVVGESEKQLLPPVEVIVGNRHTTVILFSKKAFNELSTVERIEACYQHTCVNYMARKSTTNESLRARLGLGPSKSSTVSQIIKAAKTANRIKDKEVNMSKKKAGYIPFWA